MTVRVVKYCVCHLLTVFDCGVSNTFPVGKKRERGPSFKLSGVTVNAKTVMTCEAELAPLDILLPADKAERKKYSFILWWLLFITWSTKDVNFLFFFLFPDGCYRFIAKTVIGIFLGDQRKILVYCLAYMNMELEIGRP